MGDLKPDIDISGEFSDEGIKAKKKKDEESDLDLEHESFYKKYDEKLKRKFERLGGAKQQLKIARESTDNAKAVVKFWVMRARLRQRVQI